MYKPAINQSAIGFGLLLLSLLFLGSCDGVRQLSDGTYVVNNRKPYQAVATDGHFGLRPDSIAYFQDFHIYLTLRWDSGSNRNDGYAKTYRISKEGKTYNPSISRDGNMVAYLNATRAPSARCGILTVRDLGSGETLYFDNAVAKSASPSWDASGQNVAFKDTSGNIKTINISTGDIQTMIASPVIDFEFRTMRLAPFSNAVSFAEYKHENGVIKVVQIYVYDTRDKSIITLNSAGDDLHITPEMRWHKDSYKLMYRRYRTGRVDYQWMVYDLKLKESYPLFEPHANFYTTDTRFWGQNQ